MEEPEPVSMNITDPSTCKCLRAAQANQRVSLPVTTNLRWTGGSPSRLRRETVAATAPNRNIGGGSAFFLLSPRRIRLVGICFANSAPIREDARPKKELQRIIGTIPYYLSTRCWWSQHIFLGEGGIIQGSLLCHSRGRGVCFVCSVLHILLLGCEASSVHRVMNVPYTSVSR